MVAWAHTVGQMFSMFCISATNEPVCPYNFVSGLHSPYWNVTPCPPSVPASHPFVSTRDTTYTHATAQIFYFIWWETLKATTSSKGCLKGNKLMYTVCKFHTHACFLGKLLYNNLKSLKPFVLKLIMCDLDRFSEFQSLLQLFTYNKYFSIEMQHTRQMLITSWGEPERSVQNPWHCRTYVRPNMEYFWGAR